MWIDDFHGGVQPGWGRWRRRHRGGKKKNERHKEHVEGSVHGPRLDRIRTFTVKTNRFVLVLSFAATLARCFHQYYMGTAHFQSVMRRPSKALPYKVSLPL